MALFLLKSIMPSRCWFPSLSRKWNFSGSSRLLFFHILLLLVDPRISSRSAYLSLATFYLVVLILSLSEEAPLPKVSSMAYLEHVSLAGCRRLYLSKVWARAKAFLRNSLDSGLVCWNVRLRLRVEVWKSWLLESECEIHETSSETKLMNLSQCLARQSTSLATVASLLDWTHIFPLLK